MCCGSMDSWAEVFRQACSLARKELVGGGQSSVRLAHVCMQLPYGVKVVGVARKCSDDIHELSASHMGGFVFQEKLVTWGALTQGLSVSCLNRLEIL